MYPTPLSFVESMEKKHRELLRRNRVTLVDDLEPKHLLSYLLQERALSLNDIDSIKAEQTRVRQAEKVLDFLPRRGPKAFGIFCRALQQTDGQGHLAEILLESESAASGKFNIVKTSVLL